LVSKQSKPNYGEGISKEVYNKTIYFFEIDEIASSVHAFPVEEIWQLISERRMKLMRLVAQQKSRSFIEDIKKTLKLQQK
jgi:valyl-tRNA synthetase